MNMNQLRTIIAFAGAAGLVGCTAMGSAPPAPPIPDAPPLVQPVSNAPEGEVVYTDRVVLEWEPVAHADGYGVYLSEFDGSDWRLVYNSEATAGGPLGTTSVALPADLLQDDGQYRWNARAWSDQAGWGAYSPPAEFSVDLRTDAELHQLVHEHLERAPGVDATAIKVEVLNGQVTMNGCVATPHQRELAHEIAHSIGGVQLANIESLETC